MFKNDFFKQLGLKRAQSFVGAATDYSDSATYAHFLENAVEGELGFYNADTNTLISTAIGAGTPFFVALKRGGKTLRSTTFNSSEIKLKKKNPYSAPQKHLVEIICGTRATKTVGNIKYTAINGGTDGNAITVTVVDPSGNNASLSIGVSGTDITVNLATDGSSAPTSTGTQVLEALQASAQVKELVRVEGTGTMSTVQAAAAQGALAGGTNGTAPTAGKEYSLQIQDCTTATQPFPTYMYSEVAVAGDTLATIMARLAARINSTTSHENRDRDLIVTATVSDDYIALEAKKYGTIFRVQLREELAAVASVNVYQHMKIGSGYYQHVAELEQYGDIFGGVTTNYPENHATPEEFGKPVSLVSASNTYNTYMVSLLASEASRTPHNVWHNPLYLIIASPSNGTNPSSTIDTVLGV